MQLRIIFNSGLYQVFLSVTSQKLRLLYEPIAVGLISEWMAQKIRIAYNKTRYAMDKVRMTHEL